MQRLFSSFPTGSPGAGLLLLRLILGSVLIATAVAAWYRSPSSLVIMLACVELLTGVAIVLGVWTPIVGVIVCLLQLGSLLKSTGSIDPHLMRAAAGLSLALLGPGAWSIDARLFGRRRVEIKHLRDG